MDMIIRYYLSPAFVVLLATSVVFAQGYEEGRSAYIRATIRPPTSCSDRSPMPAMPMPRK